MRGAGKGGDLPAHNRALLVFVLHSLAVLWEGVAWGGVQSAFSKGALLRERYRVIRAVRARGVLASAAHGFLCEAHTKHSSIEGQQRGKK